MFLDFSIHGLTNGLDGCRKLMEGLNANVLQPRSIQCNVPGENRHRKMPQSVDGPKFTLSAGSANLWEHEQLINETLLYTELKASWEGLSWETDQVDFVQTIKELAQHPSPRLGQGPKSNEVAWRFWGPTRIYADTGNSRSVEVWAFREFYESRSRYDQLMAVWGHWDGQTNGSINCSFSISTFAFSHVSSLYDPETRGFLKKETIALADENSTHFAEQIRRVIKHIDGTHVNWEYERDNIPLEGILLDAIENAIGPSYTTVEIANI